MAAAAELSNLCSNLSLQEADRPKVIISKDLIEEGDSGAVFFSLIGKLLTKRKANLEGMRTTLFNAWKLEMGLIVKELGDKLYMFQFEDDAERDRVLVTQSWHFNRILLVLKEYDGVERPEEVWAAVEELLGPVLEIDDQHENDCLVATEMRLRQGFVTKRYTTRIKAESLRFESSSLEGGGGRLIQQSLTVGDNQRSSRPHVDSMLLRGKQVAHALFSEDDSCEVLSRMPEKEGPKIVEQGETVINSGLSNVDSGLVGEIPSVGLSNAGLGEATAPVVSSPMEGALSEQNLALLQNDKVKQLLSNLADSVPFVFGTHSFSSSSTRQVRKWKKAARGSQVSSLDVVAGQNNVKERRKRLSSSSILMQNNGGLVKRCREHAMEVDLVGFVARDAEGLATHTSGNNVLEAVAEQEDACGTAEVSGRLGQFVGYDFCFAMDCNGRSGGLAFLWMADNNVSLLSNSFFHIDVRISIDDNDGWRFTGFYGRPETCKRHESWSLFRSLRDRSSLP
ncbi:hypothetical protein CCACVL1_04904 [Corchorus capsularis]|uniref:DUF4283 domain-containing protein n=1 Tax=Corchorus capsularis TaxID=210143 RepID=A0A1R3JNY7_COCAP|nr:hypothetical protein CCACVL1_04904 [Corchorus capsularis]